MKFLLFNAAVIAALVYLAGADQGDFQAAAERLTGHAQETAQAAHPAAAPVLDKVERDPPSDTPPIPQADAKLEPQPTHPDPVDSSPAVPESGPGAQAELAQSLPPVGDPAVARRRAEVLDGITSVEASPGAETPIVAPDNVPEITLAEGEALMSPEERLRELYALAEEMELLFVTKLAR